MSKDLEKEIKELKDKIKEKDKRIKDLLGVKYRSLGFYRIRFR